MEAREGGEKRKMEKNNKRASLSKKCTLKRLNDALRK